MMEHRTATIGELNRSTERLHSKEMASIFIVATIG